MPNIIDLTGKTFGRLKVTARAENGKDNSSRWLCLCACGKEKTIRSKSLRTGSTVSCGCFRSEKMRKEKYDFYTVNFANADMVGHTGDLSATVKACEILDQQIEILSREVLKRGGNLIITADHGNAEKMFDEKANQAYTYHTKNPVPFIVCNKRFQEFYGIDGIKAGESRQAIFKRRTRLLLPTGFPSSYVARWGSSRLWERSS